MNAMRLACLALALLLAAPASGQEVTGPRLGAASNMGQGITPRLTRLATALGVRDLRDGLSWTRAEQRAGDIRFDGARLTFPDQMAQMGIAAGIVLNWGNPLFDDGDTPHTPAAIDAFGGFAAQVATRFPNLDHLEIGNEFNGVNFVRGPLAEMSPLERARAYVPLLASAATQVRAVRPDLRILGGATHSIPAGWLWEVLDAGGAEHMDALAIHPYTTPAEQLVRQLAVLRRHPDAARLPIEVTEFGHPDPARAAGHFLRNYCQMALGGVTRAVWYPFNERGDGLVPLVADGGRVTSAGRAFRLIAERMEGRPVRDAAPDPFTYACRFGGDVTIVWGAPRGLDLPEGVTVLDAEGAVVTAPATLSEKEPLVLLHADGAEAIAARTDIAADSYHQFAYPAANGDPAPSDGFDRFARRGGTRIDLVTLPGQEASGTPWFPYLGVPALRPLRLTAETLVPGGGPADPVEILHRYVAPVDQVLTLEARFDVPDRSADGIAVTISLDGEVLAEASGKDPFDITRNGIALAEGQTLDIAVGPNGTPRGDVIGYRITLRHE
ncbi:glycosyl hydrolase [Jannaschia pohangensis]|uniref:Glycosyl hydrolase catalytic core n=1 Tax=Jannaschia pohangensis TaxID=390807 RepID=A0A1I3QVN0_9RHOB|nr:glycosyl hydrolase [Jannaschia pohangensis]SFJ37166.1 Glycosyl hydrolase catalytic core [Jannaschia pohangensis]